MTHTERKTKKELEEIYNDPTPSKMWGTLGERARSGVAVLGGETDYGSAGVAKHEYIIGPKGEVRWAYSNNIVPGDILEMAVVDGTIDIALRNRTEEVRVVEDAEFFAQYRANREKYGYSEEEKAEMRANSDGDEEWVDIITGKAIQL